MFRVHSCYISDVLRNADLRGKKCSSYSLSDERALALFRSFYPEEIEGTDYRCVPGSTEAEKFKNNWLNKGFRFLARRGSRLYVLKYHDFGFYLQVLPAEEVLSAFRQTWGGKQALLDLPVRIEARSYCQSCGEDLDLDATHNHPAPDDVAFNDYCTDCAVKAMASCDAYADVVEAYYLFYSFWHLGQNSEEYEKLSKILEWFKPRDSLRDEDNLSEFAREIYDRLCDENGVEQEEVDDA